MSKVSREKKKAQGKLHEQKLAQERFVVTLSRNDIDCLLSALQVQEHEFGGLTIDDPQNELAMTLKTALMNPVEKIA